MSYIRIMWYLSINRFLCFMFSYENCYATDQNTNTPIQTYLQWTEIMLALNAFVLLWISPFFFGAIQFVHECKIHFVLKLLVWLSVHDLRDILALSSIVLLYHGPMYSKWRLTQYERNKFNDVWIVNIIKDKANFLSQPIEWNDRFSIWKYKFLKHFSLLLLLWLMKIVFNLTIK